MPERPLTTDAGANVHPLLVNGLPLNLPAGATIGGSAIAVFNPSQTAVLYVDALGSNTTGQRGNPNKPYLTAAAAYAAASAGDTIRLGTGTFTLMTTGAIKQVAWEGVNIGSTSLTITANSADTNWQLFRNLIVAVTYQNAATLSLGDLYLIRTTATFVYNAPHIILGGGIYGWKLDILSYVNASGGASVSSVTGALTLIGGYADNVISFNFVDPAAEIYLIESGGAVALYSDNGSTKGGEINAISSYGLDLTAATIRIQNSSFNLRNYTTLVDGGGNRDENADITVPSEVFDTIGVRLIEQSDDSSPGNVTIGDTATLLQANWALNASGQLGIDQLGTFADLVASTPGTLTIADHTTLAGLGWSLTPAGALVATSFNGNTITTGTGVLTLGSYTLTAAQSGTLGTAAYTAATAYDASGAAAAATATAAQRASNLSDLASASTARTNLGLGTAATQNTGTSGANVPLLNAANTWASGQIFVAPVLGIPASGVATNLTGTAAGLTAGNVSTNANLTGDVTSVGNATTIGASKVTSAMLVDGTIVNADINASAAVAYSKLALTGAILNADLAGSIAYSKLSLTGAILNADLAGSIDLTSKVTGALPQANIAALTGDVTKPSGSGVTTLASIPAISGANLTTLNASNLSSGTVATARLGSGTANSGTYLAGDQTYKAIDLSGYQPLDSDLTSWAAITRASGFDTFATTPTVANLKSLLSDETTVVGNLLSLANPSAISFIKIAADNTVSTRTPAQVLSDIGAAASGANTDITSLVANTGVFSATTSLLLGTAGSAVGNVGFRNATSGTATLAPPTGALGTYTVTLPNAASTIPIASQQITWSGPTAARAYTLPDANATLARTDAANTFTGHQTIEGVTSTGATGTGKFVFDGTPTLVTPVIGAATGTSLTLSANISLATSSYIQFGGTTSSFPAIVKSGAGIGMVAVLADGSDYCFFGSGQISTAGGVRVRSVDGYAWTDNSTTNPLNAGTVDIKLGRNAPGVAEVNNGTNGTYRDLKLRHIIGGSTAPTVAAGTGAGTSPTVSVTGTDLGFTLSVTTGTVPTLSGTVATVTFNAAYGSAPHFSFTPSNSNASTLNGINMVTPGSTTTTFVVTAGATALAAATAYTWEVICVQ